MTTAGMVPFEPFRGTPPVASGARVAASGQPAPRGLRSNESPRPPIAAAAKAFSRCEFAPQADVGQSRGRRKKTKRPASNDRVGVLFIAE
jgi:hypothetical protein